MLEYPHMEIIIKNANIAALLDGADKVLQKFGKHGVPENIKGQATLSSMKRFSTGTFFDVCTVRELAKLNGVIIDTEHMELFSTLHCVHWSDIHPQTREYVQALLIDYFKGNIAMAYTGETILDK